MSGRRVQRSHFHSTRVRREASRAPTSTVGIARVRRHDPPSLLVSRVRGGATRSWTAAARPMRSTTRSVSLNTLRGRAAQRTANLTPEDRTRIRPAPAPPEKRPQARRGREDAEPGVRGNQPEASADRLHLADGLRLDLDRDLLADHDAATLEHLVEGDPEGLTVDLGGGAEPRPGVAPGVGDAALEVHVELHRLR